jgi:aryl-alcohol dehydrogenase-like predicted oxidoreductase
MPLNHYVTLGRSGLRVSPFCLGAMTFGEEWKFGSNPTDSKRVIDAFLAHGGNFIDSANMYNHGNSEKILGEYFKDPAKRDRAVIATKFSGNLFPGDPNGGGSNRKAILRACDESLRRLQTDYIDLYWLHFWDKQTPMEETMAAIDTLVQSGKVRYFGFSDTPAWKVTQAIYEVERQGLSRAARPIALQIEYSLLQRTVEGELIPMARELGLGVTPWSPLKFGILTGKYTRTSRPKEGRSTTGWIDRNLTDHAYAVVDLLIATSKELGCTPAQVALAWVQGKAGVASSIIGARTVEQLEDNIKALDVKLTAAQTARLDELTKPSLNFPHDFLAGAQTQIHGAVPMTINGETPAASDLLPKVDAERF